MTPVQIWQAAQGELQMQLSAATFNAFVKRTYVTDHADGKLTIVVEDDHMKAWWENNLSMSVNRILTGIVGIPYTAEYVVGRPA